MKNNPIEKAAWLETNRTHEECSECMFQHDMPPPCSGHVAGATACHQKPVLVAALERETRPLEETPICKQCGEHCGLVRDEIHYSGTHCTGGADGVHWEGDYVSNCCGADYEQDGE